MSVGVLEGGERERGAGGGGRLVKKPNRKKN